ncbi:hypothetical protein SAMN00777080_2776 [Aquiflexum balticum DSM 16537]|uniref:Uncharacterized protein n=1 Tax=Aquiflexum balticum DSM 16537 TaxID=758820 RepID=A0A1W2H5I2_9BACT|nr:hypothetical protein SAMN00777080_2776 [Aquiflexum balticum DSM 16537]
MMEYRKTTDEGGLVQRPYTRNKTSSINLD